MKFAEQQLLKHGWTPGDPHGYLPHDPNSLPTLCPRERHHPGLTLCSHSIGGGKLAYGEICRKFLTFPKKGRRGRNLTVGMKKWLGAWGRGEETRLSPERIIEEKLGLR